MIFPSRDCGLQTWTIPEHAGLHINPYSTVLSVSIQSTSSDLITISLSGTNADQEDTYAPAITVTLNDWPTITWTSPTFIAEIVHPCRFVTMASTSPVIDYENTVRRAAPEVGTGPVITHSPYSGINCGALEYKLVYASPTLVDQFLTLNPSTGSFSIAAYAHNLVGDYFFTWEVSYPLYPEATKYQSTLPFKISIKPCEVQSIEPPSTPLTKVEHIIRSPIQTIDFDHFTQVPNCEYNMNYYLTELD